MIIVGPCTTPGCVEQMALVPASAAGEEVDIMLHAVDAAVLPGRLSVGSHGYAQLSGATRGRVILLHRHLLGLQPSDAVIGDHVNADCLDNRRCNLRAVSHAESSANVAARGMSGFRGVYPTNGGRWLARCKVGGRPVRLGVYDTPEEAAEVSHRFRLENLPGYVDRPAARRTA